MLEIKLDLGPLGPDIMKTTPSDKPTNGKETIVADASRPEVNGQHVIGHGCFQVPFRERTVMHKKIQV